MAITAAQIARINELARKSKAEGLTDAETAEQAALRQEYIAALRKNLRGQLDKIDIREADGSITNLGEKYGEKANHGKKGNQTADLCQEKRGGCRPAGEKQPDHLR